MGDDDRPDTRLDLGHALNGVALVTTARNRAPFKRPEKVLRAGHWTCPDSMGHTGPFFAFVDLIPSVLCVPGPKGLRHTGTQELGVWCVCLISVWGTHRHTGAHGLERLIIATFNRLAVRLQRGMKVLILRAFRELNVFVLYE